MDDPNDEDVPVVSVVAFVYGDLLIIQPPRRDDSLKDGEGRPGVKKYKNVLLSMIGSLRVADVLTCHQGFKFRRNDKVRIKGTTTQGLRGPYTVSDTHTGPKYTLEESNGSSVDNGKKFDEDELEHAN
jgi:hypothetical protein